MSKGLDALKRLEDFYSQFGGCDETGEYKNYNDLYHTLERQIIRKELKALEIIKEKKVDVPYIIENPEEKDVIWYNARFMGVLCEGWRMLTQEEYDLLKEVLL